MKITIHPFFSSLNEFIRRLPGDFDRSGALLHEGRNAIRAFDIAGERYAVKRYQRPHLLNRIAYTCLRKSKAQRAYEHGLRLLAIGIDTPQPVAWVETHHRGLLEDALFVCRYTDLAPLSDATRRFPEPDTLPVLTAFARFAATLHEKGVLHEDFNQTNILYRADPTTGGYRFQLIDANRMRFRRDGVGERASAVNLRRLSCPGEAYLYILDAYSRARNWDKEETILRGALFRLLFRRRQRIKAEFKRLRKEVRNKKKGRNLHS